MSNHIENPASMARFSDSVALIGDGIVSRIGRVEPYVAFWWIFIASVSASSLGRIFPELSGPLAYVITIAGTAGCAWMWLFSRALFRPAHSIGPWSVLAVGAVMAVESSWALTSGRLAGGMAGEFYRVADNAASLICIAAIVFVFVEALSGVGAMTTRRERRFRYAFVAVYGLVITVALVGVSGAGGDTLAAQWKNSVLTGCAIVAAIGSRAAISFRRRNPLTDNPRRRRDGQSQRRDVNPGPLARRIQDAVSDEQLLSTPGLKVADFAKALGEQEYKITQCLTGALGYRNFNHFINAHRIEHAKSMLSDACHDARSVSSIAYACGFNSIGPFNRAFKDEVGVTPSAFRAGQ